MSAGEIGKGFAQVSKDTLVAVTDEELERMPLPTAKAIEIVAFVPAASIDPVRLSGDSYFLQYDGPCGGEAVRSDRPVLVEHEGGRGRSWRGTGVSAWCCCGCGTGRWSRTCSSGTMRRPRPLRARPEGHHGHGLRDRRGAATGRLDDDGRHLRLPGRVPEGTRGGHRGEGRGPEPPKPTEEAEETGGQVVDLMAALQESVRKAQAARGEDAADAEVHEMPKKTTRRWWKAPAKKTAKKTAAAKKTGRQRGA